MEFNTWKQEVIEELQERFALAEEECADDEVLHTCYDCGESPYEVVDWIGQKYDLDEVRAAH